MKKIILVTIIAISFSFSFSRDTNLWPDSVEFLAESSTAGDVVSFQADYNGPIGWIVRQYDGQTGLYTYYAKTLEISEERAWLALLEELPWLKYVLIQRDLNFVKAIGFEAIQVWLVEINRPPSGIYH